MKHAIIVFTKVPEAGKIKTLGLQRQTLIDAVEKNIPLLPLDIVFDIE